MSETPFHKNTQCHPHITEALVQYFSESGKEMVLRVSGWSMGATLAPSSEVVVRPLRRAPRFGEILVVRGDGSFLVHRMVGRDRGNGALIITRGDNCTKADPPVPLERVVGLVAGILKPDGPWVPWHWKWPLSCLAALVSRFHPLAWEPYHRLFRWIDYCNWRVQEKWRKFRQKSGMTKPCLMGGSDDRET